jgi:hypothetical protein
MFNLLWIATQEISPNKREPPTRLWLFCSTTPPIAAPKASLSTWFRTDSTSGRLGSECNPTAKACGLAIPLEVHGRAEAERREGEGK